MSKITKIFLLLLLLFLKVGNIRIMALENTLPDYSFSSSYFFENPQILSTYPSWVLLIKFSPNKFSIPELDKLGIGYIGAMDLFSRELNAGLFLEGENSQLFSRIKMILPLAIKLNNSLQMGVKANYLRFQARSFSKTDSYSADINLRYKLIDDIHLATSFNNILGSSELFATQFSGAASWQNDYLFTSIGFNIVLNDRTIFYSSLYYRLSDNLSLNFSIASNPTVLNIGISLNIVDYKIVSDFSFHKVLGLEQSYFGEISF